MNRWRILLLSVASGLLLAACSDSAVLQVSNVTPATGSAGTEITLLGSGFTSSTSVTICGVALTDLHLETEERQAAAPGTVGSLAGAGKLVGTMPDLGATAACPVVVMNASGASHTWSSDFHYTSEGGGSHNEAPTTSGISDLLVDSVTNELIIDLYSAFDDKDDGVDSLSFSATVTAPGGNVLAIVAGDQLQLGFPSRLGQSAQVEVSATDPHGASVSTTFSVEFEAGRLEVTPEARFATTPPAGEITATHDGGEQIAAAWNQAIELRPGNYEVSGPDAMIPGTFVDQRARAEVVPVSLLAGAAEQVVLQYRLLEARGRLWLPTTNRGLVSLDDSALVNLSTELTSVVLDGQFLSAIVIAPDGALWVSTALDNSILRIELEDLESPNPTPTTVLTRSDDPFSFLSNLTFDASGNLWVSDYSKSIVMVFTAEQLEAGGPQEPFYTISHSPDLPLSGPGALTFDDEGNLWIGTTDNDPTFIYRFDADDLFEANIMPSLTINSTWNDARFFSLEFDANGDMWVTTDRDYLGHLAASSLTSSGSMDFDPQNGIQLPADRVMSIRFDPRGNLWALHRDSTLSTILADELYEPVPAVMSRDLAISVDTGIFVFLE